MGSELAAVVAGGDRDHPALGAARAGGAGCRRAWPEPMLCASSPSITISSTRPPRQAVSCASLPPASGSRRRWSMRAAPCTWSRPSTRSARAARKGQNDVPHLLHGRNGALGRGQRGLLIPGQDQEISAADRFHQPDRSPRTRTRRPSRGCASSACRRSAWRSGSRRRSSAAIAPAPASPVPPPPGCRRRRPWSDR